MFIRYWPTILFFYDIFGFDIRVMLTSQKEFRSFPSSVVFCNFLKRAGVNSSPYVWQNSSVKLSCPELLFVGSFKVTDSLLIVGLFVFSIFSWFSLERLCLPKNLSISSMLSALLACSCLQQSLKTLSISVVLLVPFPLLFCL